MDLRLQKLLASAGIGSRRYCETLIAAGRVSVNGKQVKDPGTKADPEKDNITVDGKPITTAADHLYIVLNKPLGYVSTVSDPHAKHTVMDLVSNVDTRIYPVGRLDADSAGLLLLTNDGDFTQTLTHPSHQVPKTYRVVARGLVPEWAGADLSKGIILEDGMTAPAEVEWVDYDEENNASIIDISIHEGRNRQVRRMFDAIGYPVLALTRTRIGPVELKGLAPGTWRKLHSSEVKALIGAADSAPLALPQVPVDNPDEFDIPLEDEEAPQRKPAERASRPAPQTPRSQTKRPERTTESKGKTPVRRPDSSPSKPAAAKPADKKSSALRDEAARLAAQLNAMPDEEVDASPKNVRKNHDAPQSKKPFRKK